MIGSLLHGTNTVFGQLKEQLPSKFREYQQHNLQEKVYLHTDRDFYLAGEIIWFSIYCVDVFYHRPLSLSRLTYVELLNKDNKPVLQAKIEMNSGFGNGSFLLPAYLNSSRYRIRAYTAAMRNLEPDYFFEKDITVVNTQRDAGLVTRRDTGDCYLKFFPEGGGLVHGVESRIAFKCTDRAGLGINGKGIVVNQNGDTVQRFQSLHLGIGSFFLKPVKGNFYKVFFYENNRLLSQAELPSASDSAYALQVADKGQDLIRVAVNAGPIVKEQKLFLFVHTRNIFKLFDSRELKDGSAEFEFSKKILDEGVSHLTVFDRQLNPVCERLLFKGPEQNINIGLKTDSAAYRPRQRIELTMDAGFLGAGDSVNLSLAVYVADSLESALNGDIRSWLLLQSDLSETIEQPGSYFERDGKEQADAIDHLLITQQWKRFDWEAILHSKKQSHKTIPEYAGHIVRGKLVDRFTGLAAEGVLAYLSVPGRQFRFASAVTDEEGKLIFDVPIFYGNSELILHVNNGSDSNYRFELETPFSSSYKPFFKQELKPLAQFREMLSKRNLAAQVQQEYYAERTPQFELPVIRDTTAFYGYPGKKYLLDDYTRFTSMEEVLREYVTEIRVKQREQQYQLNIKSSSYNSFFNNNPLVLIDGVPVFDMNKVVGLDPLRIQKMELIPRRYYLGSQVFDGIVSFTSYEGDLANYSLDSVALVLDYDGAQLKREFYKPVYESVEQKNSRLPDFRTLLHWEPRIVLGKSPAKMELYSSDLGGNYIIVLQGIDFRGRTVFASKQFSIKKQ